MVSTYVTVMSAAATPMKKNWKEFETPFPRSVVAEGIVLMVMIHLPAVLFAYHEKASSRLCIHDD